jgi:hypothetical protein
LPVPQQIGDCLAQPSPELGSVLRSANCDSSQTCSCSITGAPRS